MSFFRKYLMEVEEEQLFQMLTDTGFRKMDYERGSP